MPLVLAGATSGSTTLQATDAVTQTITLPNNTGTIITTASSGQSIPRAALPAGSVLQVVSTTKTDTFSTTSTSFTDVTGLSATITPSSSSSRILVIVSVNTGANPSGVACFKLQRNNTDIVIGDAAGSRARTTFTYYAGSGDNPSAGIGTNFLDSPSATTATVYKIVMNSNTAGQTVGVNRTMTDSDVSSSQRNTSTITLLEIAA